MNRDQETRLGNLRISRFLRKEKHDYYPNFNYRNNWNLLMGVIEEINKVENSNPILLANIQEGCINTNIEFTWKSVIKFIEWYDRNCRKRK